MYIISLLCTRTALWDGFDRASSLKLKSAGRYVAILGHIILNIYIPWHKNVGSMSTSTVCVKSTWSLTLTAAWVSPSKEHWLCETMWIFRNAIAFSLCSSIVPSIPSSLMYTTKSISDLSFTAVPLPREPPYNNSIQISNVTMIVCHTWTWMKVKLNKTFYLVSSYLINILIAAISSLTILPLECHF